MMQIFRRLLFVLLCATGTALAQQAELRSDVSKLSSPGGQLKLTAAVSYEGRPGAVGWSIQLPPDWILISVDGPHLPAVTPEAGSTGQLDFAYTDVPSNRAQFSIWVTYPPGQGAAKISATTLVRLDGKVEVITPAAVTFSR